MKARYTGPELSNDWDLLEEKHIFITYELNDISTVRAYRASGHEIGVLVAEKKWKRPHTLNARQHINKLVLQKRLESFPDR